MQMERVDEVEFQNIDEIDTNLFTDSDLDGMILIMKGNSIDRIEIICVIEVYINAVHHHDQFLIHRRTPFFRIYDEHPIESLRNMACQRENMTMIEVETKRLCIKLVDKIASRFDESARTRARYAVHFTGMEAMKVHRVRMITSVAEVDSNMVAFRGSKGRTGNSAVICPRRKLDPRNNLDIFIEGNDFVLTQGLS